MNKLKTFMLIFSLFLSIISEPLLAATGFVSVSSGVNISASPVVLGKNFSIGFTLREVNGKAKTFENVAIAILDPSGKFIFDFATYSNVKVGAYGTWSNTATNLINTNRPAGTYKVVIRGKLPKDNWFDFNAVGSGVTPKAFTVVKANQPPPPPPPPAIPLAPTLKTPANAQPNVPKANVNFSWDASARATSYRIVVSQNQSFSGFNPSNLTCDGTCGTDKITTGTSQTRNLLLDGTTYYWKVNASNATGTSAWSGVRSFTTAGVPVSPLSAKVDAFVTKWLGKGTWYGGYKNNFQCVALMRQYLLDVFSLNSSILPSTGTAYSIYDKATDSRFTKITNTPTAVPQKGDIIFWNKLASNGNYGHVAIVLSANANSFVSIDQNWFNSNTTTGSVAAKVTHNYSGVVGWLHPK